MNILYVHGYGSKAYGETYYKLVEAIPEHKFFSTDYNQCNLTVALEELKTFIKENDISLVIGASLGGFMTMNLKGVSRIVVNPSLNPMNDIPESVNLVGCEELVKNISDYWDFEEMNLCTICYSTRDELFNSKYINDYKRLSTNTFEVDCGHRLNDVAIQQLKSFIIKHEDYVVEYVEGLKKFDEIFNEVAKNFYI